MTELIFFVALGGFFLFGAVLIFLFSRQAKGQGAEAISLMQQQLQDLRNTLDLRLGDSTKLAQQQSQESIRLIKEITQELVRVGEGQKQVLNVTDQLKNLQDILKNPKQRGVLGEYYLETLLKNVMPPGSYQMQYGFADGTIVDAAIFVKEKIIPVDSKFSLENYNRIAETSDAGEKIRLEKVFVNDLKNRIEETAKYIQPEQGTTDFAFMFIPHEAIYYDLLVNKIGAITEETENLVQRAAGKYRVIIVSPTSFLAYLQTVLQGLKAMQIEESAKLIQKRVGELGKHIASYDMYMKKLGTHLGTTVGTYNTAYKELGKIDKDVLRITGNTEEKIDALELDRPKTEEE
ncbi:MAG: DNA recombination protein RmuC [Candidatus Yanofskybacteria bacterium]|nr:DNA recombination protein RmuC [Candidatus Yanofskybacteria bacterium]